MATIDVWPRLGTTVTLSGGAVITAAGASVTDTAEIYRLLNAFDLLTSDPTEANPNPSPLPADNDPGDATVYVVPEGSYSVTGDGVTDDRTALNTLANTTISASGGTITFQGPYTYVIGSNVTFPLHVTLRLLHGAILKPSAGVTVTVLGPVDAGVSQHFDTSASGSRIALVGKTVYPEWWGAKSDSGTTDNVNAITAAVKSIGGLSVDGGGGTVSFTASEGYYGVSAPMTWISGTLYYNNITVEGRGWSTWVKKTQNDTTLTNPSVYGIFTFFHGGAQNPIRNIVIRNMKISGYSTTDYVQCVQFGFANAVRFERLWITDTAREGLYLSGPNGCTDAKYIGCKAERVGLLAGQPLSAFNANSNEVVIDGCSAFDCGMGIEQTGAGCVITNNEFRRTSTRAIMTNSTSWSNRDTVVSGNIIDHAEKGIYIADQVKSLGRIIVSNNILLNLEQGINVGSRSAAKTPAMVTDNYFLGGRINAGGGIGGECIYLGAGPAVVQGNVVTRVVGATTTGSTTSGLTTLTLTGGSNLSNVGVGTTLTIAGVSGTKTITAVSQATPESDLICTMDVAADATVAGAAVTYSTGRWAYAIRAETDDYHTITENKLIGDSWTTVGISLPGALATVEDNVVEFKGESTSAFRLLRAGKWSGDPSSDFIFGTGLAIAGNLKYSSTRRSEITCTGAPASATWKVGDIQTEAAPTAGGNIGRVCTVAGTAGTLGGAVTAATTSGLTTATLSSVAGVWVGVYVTIAGVSGIKRVTAINGSVITMDVAADATVGAGAVAFSAPTWRTYGVIA